MKFTSFLLFIFLGSHVIGQIENAGIGTLTPDSSAVLELASPNKGFLLPRLTSTQRQSIQNPARSLLVFDTDSSSFWYYTGSNWQKLLPEPALPVSNLLYSFLEQTGIAGATETVVGSYVVPANTLQASGEFLEVHAFGVLTADTSELKFKIGSNQTVFSISSRGDWTVLLKVYRHNLGELKMVGTLTVNGVNYSDVVLGLQDFTSAIPFQITASQNQAVLNGVSLEGFSIVKMRY
jgi:hypothetical protein